MSRTGWITRSEYSTRYTFGMTQNAEFADVRFKVSEFAEGEPFISTLEGGPTSNTILNDRTDFLMILKDGITLEQAKSLVEHLNQHVKQISIQRH